ncbi:hypothetical protein GRF29_69g2202904 [Pseudopithomyces chartarum]|uniref:Heterokaryon incompatibility domain-containing protein n=1 Tax=Pseudopithomyces chartarum TaxID=1892770 RepID=A0AAN6RJH9_9PLEO|nr:hypothetical protein GRF29_69g2202904 [Pseudopithomyces chartarum]
MPLCNNCTSIPFRALIKGSESLPTTALSPFDTPKYHHRSHDSIQHVDRSARTCEFCRIIADAIESSFWHDNMMTKEDQKKPVWLRLTVGSDSPACSIYLGDEKPETSVFEGRLGGFDFALLPKSLQDGIMLTRFLGLQYIWIDCLCIVQDDEDDWHREAGRMGDVYSKSYLTITAARSADSNNGFLAPRETKMTDLVSLEDAEGPFQLGFRVYDVSAAPGSFETAIMEPLQTEPLTTRAWTLQERLLAPRSLHFGKQQTYWECPQTSLSENGDTFGVADEDYRLDYIVQGLQAESELRWRWYKLLEAYTSRSMTKSTDKLPALSGIAGAIQRQTKDAYYAGIWGKNFLVDLLWRLEDWRDARKPDAWRAPSWSWASVDGVIRHDEVAYATQPWAELEFCSVTPIGENPLGGVQDGFAQIRAPLTRVVNVALERSEGGFKSDVEVQGGCVRKAKLFLDFERRGECLVLMVTPISGLAVEKVDGEEETVVRGVAVSGSEEYATSLKT